MVFSRFFLHKELFRYGITGISANTIYFCLYVGLYNIGLHISLVSFISYGICLIFTYKTHKNWTFSAKDSKKKENKSRFVIVYFSSAILMSVIITFLVNYQLDYKVAWIIGALFAIVYNYFLSKYYIFLK